MKGAQIVADGSLNLHEVTPAQANSATNVIASRATSRADLLHLLDMIRPAPHAVEADPAPRRAAPRRGLEA